VSCGSAVLDVCAPSSSSHFAHTELEVAMLSILCKLSLVLFAKSFSARLFVERSQIYVTSHLQRVQAVWLCVCSDACLLAWRDACLVRLAYNVVYVHGYALTLKRKLTRCSQIDLSCRFKAYVMLPGHVSTLVSGP
jgi:hypothetical protein